MACASETIEERRLTGDDNRVSTIGPSCGKSLGSTAERLTGNDIRHNTHQVVLIS